MTRIMRRMAGLELAKPLARLPHQRRDKELVPMRPWPGQRAGNVTVNISV